ncbi:hypothetical protein FH972_024510 [Carpinus fangiana]|uniref:DUF7580 domain-containing protein n=1 Tax=Carpinus fangiana TaxID=176857 RepID=A0A5N6KYN2_9ROSI|nr:hypothetical protein FH972_024510 [Carpinus fangiana]
MYEITILNGLVDQTLNALPGLSDDHKQRLKKQMHETDWKPDSEVDCALRELFGSAMNTYEMAIKKIVRILGDLIGDPTVRISKEETDESKMYVKLEAFYASRKNHTSTTTVKERFQFWRKDEKRASKLKQLEKWNKKLERLLEKHTTTPKQTTTVVKLPPGWHKSIEQIRFLGQILHSSLTASWSCDCSIRHEARFCLKSIDRLIVRTDLAEGDFDFLIQTDAGAKGQQWQEGIILVKPTSSTLSQQQRELLTRICDAAKGIPREFCFNMLVEDVQGTPRSWKLRARKKRLCLAHEKPSLSLEDLLNASSALPLTFKRGLALTVAWSLLGLKEDTWLQEGWNKRSISFFHASDQKLDYERPFLSTCFETQPTTLPGTMLSCHSNPRILELGILLIEIHTGRTIESYRTEGDLSDGQANAFTDYVVADRVARSLNDCSLDYREAVEACLDTPWVPKDQDADLSDPRVREGIYTDVIKKLENEYEYLFREKW